MQAAFIVHIELPSSDPTSLSSVAGDIEEDLTKSGHDIISVAPWQRPNALVPTPMQDSAPLPPPSF